MRITDKLINNFKEYLIEEEKSQATTEKYVRDITAFFKKVSNCELNKSIILKYKQYLTENYAPASVNSMLSSINSFFEFNEWHTLKVKMLKIQKQIFADKSKELTKAEYEKLLDAAKSLKNKKLYYIMQTICSSGIRVSELRAITAEAVKNCRATIKSKGKMRIIILPKDLCKILTQYEKEQKITSGPVFVTKNGKPIDRFTIWKMMKALCEKAKVDKNKVFPHNLRHLFARTYYTLQKDIVRLSDILGHSSINTTRIYTMETGEIHSRHIQKLGLLRI